MHIATQHYQPEYDFPKFVGETKSLLMLASIPRSGSTFLALEMWKTGMLGSPLEYFNFLLLSKVGRWRHSVIDMHNYWNDVKMARTSPNGIFSFKMFPSNYGDVSNLDESFLEKICPSKVIYLKRNDSLAQAISYSKAIRTGAWYAGALENVKVTYDKNHIAECEISIARQHEFWMKVFDFTKADVLTISYEDLLVSPENVMKKIFLYMGIEEEKKLRLDIGTIGIQRTDETARWKDLYSLENF